MENIMKRIGNLLSVKSLVTLVLTGVFAYLAVILAFVPEEDFEVEK